MKEEHSSGPDRTPKFSPWKKFSYDAFLSGIGYWEFLVQAF